MVNLFPLILKDLPNKRKRKIKDITLDGSVWCEDTSRPAVEAAFICACPATQSCIDWSEVRIKIIARSWNVFHHKASMAQLHLQNDPLEILRKLTQDRKTLSLLEKEKNVGRFKELLKDPELEYEGGWFMCVPKQFNDALDIKHNCGNLNPGWTQSNCFDFKAEDILYDTPKAYRIWSEALQHIRLCVMVKQASSAGPTGKGNPRFPGRVNFEILLPKEDRSSLVKKGKHEMTQDDFVRFLISGPDEYLSMKLKQL